MCKRFQNSIFGVLYSCTGIHSVFNFLQIPELTDEQLAELEEKMTEEHFSFIMDLMDDIRMSASSTTVSLYNNTCEWLHNRGVRVWVRTGGPLYTGAYIPENLTA